MESSMACGGGSRPDVCKPRRPKRLMMKIAAAAAATLLLALFASNTARTDDWSVGHQSPEVVQARAGDAAWDSTGWKLLGERSVTGRYDHDSIFVGTYKDRFDKLSMVVLDSDLELIDLEVRFTSRHPYHP